MQFKLGLFFNQKKEIFRKMFLYLEKELRENIDAILRDIWGI